MIDPKLLDYQDLISKLKPNDDSKYYYVDLLDLLKIEINGWTNVELDEVRDILRQLGYVSIYDMWVPTLWC